MKNMFSSEQRELIFKLYTENKYPISKIIKECGFMITSSTIYNILKEYNVFLERKTGIRRDIIGKHYGFLTVLRIEQTAKSGKKKMWRAICSCSNCGNNSFDVNPQNLLRNSTTSCGCRRDQYDKTRGANNPHYKGYGEISGRYWAMIKSRAKNRNHSVCVSIEYAWNLFLAQNRKCKLSGLPINFAISNDKFSATTASLDRIDSKVNYIEGNVQWVHKKVNIMKNVYEQQEFIDLCKLIATNN